MASSHDGLATASIPRPIAHIKVMSSSPPHLTSLLFELPYESTIRELKDKITSSLASKPDHTTQRIIYRGRILQDAHTIGSILGASANGENLESSTSDVVTFHLALRPTGSSSPPLPPPAITGTMTTSEIAQESNSVPSPNINQQLHLQAIRQAAQSGRERLERISNPRAEVAGVGRAGPPGVIPHTISPLRVAARSLGGEPAAAPTTPASLPQTQTTRTTSRLPTTTSTVRISPPAAHRPTITTTTTDRTPLQPGLLAGSPMNSIRSPPAYIHSLSTPSEQSADLNALIQSLQSAAPPSQMYLLQGPEGQRVLLAAPPSTVTPPLQSLQRDVLRTLAVHRFLPGETIDGQSSSNSGDIPSLQGVTQDDINRIFDPQIIGLGNSLQQPVEDSTPTPRPTNNQNVGGVGAPPIFENAMRYRGVPTPQTPIPAQQQPPQGPQLQGPQGQAQQPQPVQAQANIRPVRPNQDGLTHFWLAIRLAVFVFIFAQGGSLRRKITMGALALIIFIWQTGLLNESFANLRALYREIFPSETLPPRLPTNLSHPYNNFGNNIPTPEATARLLIQRDAERRQTRFRDALVSVERSLGLFLASLVPGMHERHVQAHEERERLRLGAEAAAGVGMGDQPVGGTEVPPPLQQHEQQEQEQDPEPQRIDDAMGGLMM